MKYLVILITFILMSSFYIVNDVEEFHIKMEGKKNVETFKKKHPQIIKDRAVYIAYLQKYYKGNENEFISLLKH